MTGPGGAAKGNPEYEVMGVTRHWRYSRSRMQQMIDDEMVVQTSPGAVPRRKHYLNRDGGVPVQSLWDDIAPLHSQAKERLGYPTQKPRALLERIITASSRPGDVVLDPFCGGGTTLDAAQRLDRNWIGIDVTSVAIGMVEDRVRSSYPNVKFEVFGLPTGETSALRLAADNPHQFQQWIIWALGGMPSVTRGGGAGVDGWFEYLAESGELERGVVSVKTGKHVSPSMVRDLGRVMQRDGHRLGLFITIQPPTPGMLREARSHPDVETASGTCKAIQFLTLESFCKGHRLPPSPVIRRGRTSQVDTRVSHRPEAQPVFL